MNFQNAVFEMSAGLSSQLPQSELPEVVFSGRSNVGKSSLMNKLLNRKSLARVSAMPGKTITINFYRLDKARLVDLPGYGYAKRPASELARFGELCEGYFAGGRNIALIVQLIDMRHPCSKDDMNMISFLREYDLPFVLILTKSDKLNKTERTERLKAFDEQLSEFGEIPMIPFSAKNGEGAEEIRRIICDYAEK